MREREGQSEVRAVCVACFLGRREGEISFINKGQARRLKFAISLGDLGLEGDGVWQQQVMAKTTYVYLGLMRRDDFR